MKFHGNGIYLSGFVVLMIMGGMTPPLLLTSLNVVEESLLIKFGIRKDSKQAAFTLSIHTTIAVIGHAIGSITGS